MKSPVLVRLSDNLLIDKVTIETIVEANLTGKLDRYVSGSEVTLELILAKNKTGRFNGTLRGKVGTQDAYYEREDYSKLDDLVNHLFDHLKESLSHK